VYDHQTRGVDSTQVNAVDRGLWCIVSFGPGCPIQDDIRLHVGSSKVSIRIAADAMDEWSRKDAKTQREKTEGLIQMQWSHVDAEKTVRGQMLCNPESSSDWAENPPANDRSSFSRGFSSANKRFEPGDLLCVFASLRLCVRLGIAPNATDDRAAASSVTKSQSGRSAASCPSDCSAVFVRNRRLMQPDYRAIALSHRQSQPSKCRH
jgi:hypothetical protein